MKNVRLIIIFLSISGMVNTFVSEAQSTPIRVISIPHPITFVLRSGIVHEELNLQANQIKDIDKAVSNIELSLWRLRDISYEKGGGTASLLIDQLQEKLVRILSKWQLERVNQIVWQAQGIESVLEPSVAARLRLSSEQIGNIKALLRTLNNKLTSTDNNIEIIPKSRSENHFRKSYAKGVKDVLSLLNKSQRETYVNLLGRPFDISHIRRIACKAP